MFTIYSLHTHHMVTVFMKVDFKKKYTEQFVKSSILWETIDV